VTELNIVPNYMYLNSYCRTVREVVGIAKNFLKKLYAYDSVQQDTQSCK